ncbi:hypothetical protein ASC76_19145 [Rhizobacter sp. Root404]|nr:hypothetical protein ASC76_19145 [Rhizobacter sp. Root404]
MTRFETKNIMSTRTRKETITGGESASFPHTGASEAEYHTIGAEIEGSTFNASETKIMVDDELIASHYTSRVDEKMLSYSIRGPLTEAMGDALAKAYDRTALATGVLAARSANKIVGLPGGSQVELAGVSTDPKILAKAIYKAAEILENKGVGRSDVCVFVDAGQYFALVQNLDAINKDFGGMGSYADGTIVRIAGMELVMVAGNVFPNKDLSTDAAITAALIPGVKPANYLAKYRGDFSKTVALVMHKYCIGTVQLFDLNYSLDWIADKRIDLHVAAYVIGHGVLRPECAVEICEE